MEISGKLKFWQRWKTFFYEGKLMVIVPDNDFIDLIFPEPNHHTRKYALHYSHYGQVGLVNKTGFDFSGHDFWPNPDFVDWETWGGLILCWRSMRNPKLHIMPEILKEQYRTIEILQRDRDIDKRLTAEHIKVRERYEVVDEKKKDAFYGAGMLRDIQKIVNYGKQPEEDKNKNPFDLINQ